MTAIVAIRCRDGVVVGADSSATFTDGQSQTIETPTDRKIEIIGGEIIVAGTGYIGHAQRFLAVLQRLYETKKLNGKSGIDVAKLLSSKGIEDFKETHVTNLGYSAFVAYPAGKEPFLCELAGGLGFQPEIKDPRNLWFASMGSGQTITDPFLAFLRKIFWHDGPPKLQGGIFTALWALRHVCEVNSGGIKGPVKIAILSRLKNKLVARMLDDDELAEHNNIVSDSEKYLARYREVLEGKVDPQDIPRFGGPKED